MSMTLDDKYLAALQDAARDESQTQALTLPGDGKFFNWLLEIAKGLLGNFLTGLCTPQQVVGQAKTANDGGWGSRLIRARLTRELRQSMGLRAWLRLPDKDLVIGTLITAASRVTEPEELVQLVEGT